MPDREWKSWLELVRPLMLPGEISRAKQVPPSQRADFQGAFWRARNPDPASAKNTVRAELEKRIETAPRRFRYNGTGPWNDCGRVWVLLGQPTRMAGVRGSGIPSRFYDGAVNDMDAAPTILWVYRLNPHLPTMPEEFTFQLNSRCEFASARPNERLLEEAAASYLTGAK